MTLEQKNYIIGMYCECHRKGIGEDETLKTIIESFHFFFEETIDKEVIKNVLSE